VQVQILGSLVVRNARGSVIEIAGDRQRLLVALLAHRLGQTVPADVLAEAIWGADYVRDPKAALHSLVARVRRTLEHGGEGDALRTDPSGYRLDADRASVDRSRFEHLLGDADDAAPAIRAQRLAEALSLWRGRAYDEFADLDELRLEGARLDELRLVAEERYGLALIEAGRPADAIAHLQRLVDAEPFREGPVAALMRALHAAGRQGDALRCFGRYRDRLGNELGLEPSAALVRLERSIAAEREGPTSWQAPTPFEELRVSYVASGRHPHLRLAVGETGRGHTVVAIPAWVTSLDVFAAHGDPRSALLERLARHHRVVLYDQPGTGLSRGEVTDYSLDGAVADLIAVIEATGGAPVSLLAMSAAGPCAVAVAARRPNLVRDLVLFGTFADPSVAFPDTEFSRALVEVVRARWGRGTAMVAQLFRPGVSDAAAERLGGVLRDSADPVAGAAYLAATFTSDAGPLLASVHQPALVIHYRGDKVVPFAGGEHLASSLPDARFLPLDGGYHLPDVTDVDRLERAVGGFLDGTSR
jgi:DNA-binding SARP family transcriptional activator/pimeloyl-ACP methyl ester carboxylesterase